MRLASGEGSVGGSMALTESSARTEVVKHVSADTRFRPPDAFGVNPLGERIAWILTNRGISQRELARRSGLQGAHVTMILKRLRASETATVENDTLVALARGSGVSVRWLATGEGDADELVDPPAPDEVPPDSRDTGFVSPKFRNLPNWSRLVDAARSMDPSIPAWAWEQLGESSPFLVGPASPGLVLSCAKVVREHGTPPPGAGRR